MKRHESSSLKRHHASANHVKEKYTMQKGVDCSIELQRITEHSNIERRHKRVVF